MLSKIPEEKSKISILDQIPYELVQLIALYLPSTDIVNFMCTNKSINACIDQINFWRDHYRIFFKKDMCVPKNPQNEQTKVANRYKKWHHNDISLATKKISDIFKMILRKPDYTFGNMIDNIMCSFCGFIDGFPTDHFIAKIRKESYSTEELEKIKKFLYHQKDNINQNKYKHFFENGKRDDRCDLALMPSYETPNADIFNGLINSYFTTPKETMLAFIEKFDEIVTEELTRKTSKTNEKKCNIQ